MRRSTLLILCMLALVIPAVAQRPLAHYMSSDGSTSMSERIFFVYRNDSKFDAFFHSRVDSITYSKIDLEGVEREHYVVQEVWTADSVCRIPIESIDSIGLRQPETVINRDVFPFKAIHDSYLSKADTLSFTMDINTPADMLPQKGSVVVAEPECLSFPNGILARVTKIDLSGEGYSYTCEPATVDDIFDQIVFYGSGETADPVTDPADTRRRISLEKNLEIWNKTFDGTIEQLAGTTYHVNDRATCEIKICKTLTQPLYASITLNNAFEGNVALNINMEKDYAPDPKQIGRTLKVGRITFPHPLIANLIWLEPQISFFGYFKAHGELEANFEAHLNRTDAINLCYSNKEWSIKHTPTMDAGVDAANLSMKGWVEAGLIPEIMLALNGSATGVGITGKLGVKQTLDFKFDALQCYDSGVYESLKDTHTDTYLTYATSIFVQSGLFDKNSPRKEYKVLDSEKMLLSKYVFPLFKNPTSGRAVDGSHLVTFTTERDPLLPYKFGMRIYDEDGTYVATSTDTIPFTKDVTRYSFRFKNLDIQKVYYAYPTISLGKVFTVQANPAIEVNRCPAEIVDIEPTTAFYDSSDSSYPYCMAYALSAKLSTTEGVTEWGVTDGTNFYPFDSVQSDEVVVKNYVTAIPYYSYLAYQGSTYMINFTTFEFEVDVTERVYVKMVDSNGNESVRYADPMTRRLRYDERPSLRYSNAKIDQTQYLGGYNGSNGYVQQFRTQGSFDMDLKGTFWISYIDGAASGGYSMDNNPAWRPTYNGSWRSQWVTTYTTVDPCIDHSNWHQLHLRNSGRTFKSDLFNWISNSGGVITQCSITPSPDDVEAQASSAPAKAPVTPVVVTEDMPVETAPALSIPAMLPVDIHSDHIDDAFIPKAVTVQVIDPAAPIFRR